MLKFKWIASASMILCLGLLSVFGFISLGDQVIATILALIWQNV